MSKTYLNYINGEWITSQSNETMVSKNPANYTEEVGQVQSSTSDDVNKAVTAAKNALKGWKNTSPLERGEYLRKAADLLEERIDDIATTATLEMGKTLAETKGEVARGVAILRYYAQEGYRKIGDNIPSAASNNLLYTTRVPVGVVGVVSPWNFPIAIPIWKMAPALVYGNTVILKPASETAITAVKIMEAFAEAGFPSGVVNIVTGRGSRVGNSLIENTDVNAITFTGSNEVGKNIAVNCIQRGAKYQLEMGGKNPVIVLDDADLDLAATLTVSGSMKHTGQKCTATSRVYIHESVYDEFKEKVLAQVSKIKIGPGLAEDTYMGPLSSKSQLDTVLSYVEKGKEEGASLIFGGKTPTDEAFKDGYYVEPTVFENVKNSMSIAQEEIFGPVLCLIKVSNLEEGLEQANDNAFGLSASVFTNNLGKSFTFVNEIDAGLIKVNGESAGVELQAPFGGMKASSSHSREQGEAAKEFFTSIKTVTITPVQ
ncbi:aldehyde dehydrogenase family protein [Evansella sp. AB-P1]|uniref:alpha-ketoglutaric semialdehyde dehydrogenase GucD n=1 Tax=Evansella sp. AB-P1 TaxID=3037653 RepID=UPI00241D50FD|nr:alpha-ketoglutaric semialdehyde dehydrogenase GucD [Evansella sp. AB-P1]MDG5787224.1 aldehyde dehydrogenase family protein [Evansella sp. AB-P1]